MTLVCAAYELVGYRFRVSFRESGVHSALTL
jgi:hypothetical protein